MFWQFGQVSETETDAPHSIQNLLPSGMVALQREHSINNTSLGGGQLSENKATAALSRALVQCVKLDFKLAVALPLKDGAQRSARDPLYASQSASPTSRRQSRRCQSVWHTDTSL